MEEEKKIDNKEIFLTAFGVSAIFLSLLVALFIWFDVPNFLYLLLVFMAMFSASVAVYVKKYGNEPKHYSDRKDKWLYLYLSNCLGILSFSVVLNAWFQQNIWAIILVFLAILGIAIGCMISASNWDKFKGKIHDFIILPLIFTVFIVFWAALFIDIRIGSLQAQIVVIGCQFIYITYWVVMGRLHKKKKKEENAKSEIENP